MGKLRVAINGFGRIGRVFLRNALQNDHLQVVAINDLADKETLAHLFKYDSVHGKYQGEVSLSEKGILFDGQLIGFYSERNAENLPWGELDVDFVLESTGVFRTLEKAEAHIKSGAKRVMLSAPPKGPGIRSFVLGINEKELRNEDKVISNASCTTNSCAHIVHHIDENWGIAKGFLTTVHAYTGDQRLHDAPHSDLRRARAAARSMIPTSTGAAKAVVNLFPHLDGIFFGNAIRVPVEDGSITDMTFLLKKDASVEEINQLFKELSNSNLKGILGYTEDPIVSVDVIGNSYSGLFDGGLTQSIGNLVKVSSWYDNENGYANRCVDMLAYCHQRFFT